MKTPCDSCPWLKQLFCLKPCSRFDYWFDSQVIAPMKKGSFSCLTPAPIVERRRGLN